MWVGVIMVKLVEKVAVKPPYVDWVQGCKNFWIPKQQKKTNFVVVQLEAGQLYICGWLQ